MVSSDSNPKKNKADLGLKKLTTDQIRRIDSLLASLGDYGEVRLIVQHGELRYINKVESYKAWKDDENKPDGQ